MDCRLRAMAPGLPRMRIEKFAFEPALLVGGEYRLFALWRDVVDVGVLHRDLRRRRHPFRRAHDRRHVLEAGGAPAKNAQKDAGQQSSTRDANAARAAMANPGSRAQTLIDERR